MNSEIKIGDHVKAMVAGCIVQYGIVTEISDDGFIELHLSNNDLFPTQRVWRWNRNECTKITPQEYFKQVLIRD